jgi:hypothetical protein
MTGYEAISCAVAYYNKMKDFVDEMAGLDQDYNSFVENVTRKTEISLGSLYSGLLAAKARLEL